MPLQGSASIVDIDIYHTEEDKAAYNNGLFWHTFHYIDAGLATHRSYPRIGKSRGGGPSNEHIYTTGLMMHYFLTGNAASRDAAIALAQFVIDMDDGSKTVFRWLDSGDTGLASQSGSTSYHGPGRGSANAVNALIDGFRLTQDRKFLEKAEELLHRVIHPDQNIASLNLGDVEYKWFYTMFLQALGRYLDVKMELGEYDEPYIYGRESLLHFARWMSLHEYHYLERPEILEYPTETWAAQDLRKADVFDLAAKYSGSLERAKFFTKSEFFYIKALEMLSAYSTRTFTRPMVLLLTQGWMHAWFKNHLSSMEPIPYVPTLLFKPPVRFVPQKTRALRRAKVITLSLLGLVLLSVAGLIWMNWF
jgi:hypothetical protein